MKSQFETRLQRLEEKAKRQSATRVSEEFDALCRCLGLWEIKRLGVALKAPRGDAWPPEALKILELARTRMLGGWTNADKAELDKQDREKRWALSRLRLGPPSSGSYLDTGRLDAHDVPEAEIKQLVEVAANATCASHLEPVAQIVTRLRLDGHVMEMAEFEALVLRGEIAPPPPREMFGY
jgi:hypothetical protein